MTDRRPAYQEEAGFFMPERRATELGAGGTFVPTAALAAGAATPPAAALGSYEVCSQPQVGTGGNQDKRETTRALRYRRRAAAHGLERDWARAQRRRVTREAWCGYKQAKVTGPVEIVRTEMGASWGSVQWCGNVWRCPVCSGVVRSGRRKELGEGLAAHRANGGRVVLLTLTIRHSIDHTLRDLRRVMSRAWRRLGTWRRWKGLKEDLGVLGYVRSAELTWGGNGWHLHWHYVVFVSADAPEDVAEQMQGRMTAMWADAVERTAPGQGYTPNEDHGVDAVEIAPDGDDAIGDYGTKVGDEHDEGVAMELTLADVKEAAGGHVTPWQLLDCPADAQARALWHEYCAATKGMRSVYWSTGLREALGLAEAKDDDEVLAEETEGDHDVIGAVADDVWDGLREDGRWRELDAVLTHAGKGEWWAAADAAGCGLGEHVTEAGEVVPLLCHGGRSGPQVPSRRDGRHGLLATMQGGPPG